MNIEGDGRIPDALILLELIAQSEDDFRQGRWISQAQVEQELRMAWREL
jgi:hypothetical protein